MDESDFNENELELESDFNENEKFITKYIKVIDILMKVYFVLITLISAFAFFAMGRVAFIGLFILIPNYIIAIIYFISKNTYYRLIIHFIFIYIAYFMISHI